MTHFHMDSVKNSSVLLQSENSYESNWENVFQMTMYLARSCKSSFHLFDLNQVIQRYLTWKTLLPRVKPLFGQTIQRDPKIAYILGSLGAGFSCASFRECSDCLLNCPRIQNQDQIKKEIILSNPFKLGSDMKNCRKLGITMTTFMCKSELERIKRYWPDAELLMTVAINPDLYSHELTISKLAAHPDQIDDLMNYVKELNLNLIGLSCYYGTHYKTVSNWKIVPKIASEIIDKMEAFGFKIKVLNLGDGFDYIDEENEESEWLNFQEDLKALDTELLEHFPQTREIQLIAQPGRYFTQKSELFAFKVMGKRIRMEIQNEVNGEQKLINEREGVIIVENSQYISFNFHRGRGGNQPSYWYTSNGDLKNLARMELDTEIPGIIYGFTCDSLDVICEDFLMPESISVGDFLLWVHRGTYGSCLMSQFNGMKPPKHYHFISKAMLTKFMELCNIIHREDFLFNLMEIES